MNTAIIGVGNIGSRLAKNLATATKTLKIVSQKTRPFVNEKSVPPLHCVLK